jgi:ectoine hydroxylase-related dioxygenase (phytanoyl-CoA dioxygenase family)
VTAPQIGHVAKRLMKVGRVRMLFDQAICKPGVPDGVGAEAGNFGWHQDHAYWDWIDTTNLATIWVALQDTPIERGALKTIIGSHQWGYNPDSNTAFDTDMGALRERFTAAGQPWEEEVCVLKAGQASVHHGLTYHGSGPNTTAEDRLSIVSHVMPDGAAYNRDGKWNRMLTLMGPTLKHGDAFDDRHLFPLIWPPTE